jgi:tetratricopeptide (TPR) repeat protein
MKRPPVPPLWCAAVLLVLAVPWCVQSREIVLSEETQLYVADAFMEEREYYRAVTEYKRYLILFPDGEHADYALWKMGLAYYRGEEYEPALRTFTTLRTQYGESHYAVGAQYYEGLSCWRLKRYGEAENTFRALADAHPQSEYALHALVASSLVALDTENPAASRSLLAGLSSRYPGAPDASRAGGAMALLDEYEELPRKSPVLAGVMSAVIPGSGYFYAEHFGDGFMALLVNGLAIAGAVTAIYQENYAVAGIVGGIGLPFYLGNIYGSANAARKWNLAVRNELRRRMHVALEFQF